MEDLNYLRNKIDKIDEELVSLFERRMEIVKRVAEFKNQNNLPILNEEREKQVIQKNISKLKDNQYACELEEFMSDLMQISKKIQREFINNKCNSIEKYKDSSLKDKYNNCVCAFSGVRGCFSEQALDEFFGENVKKYSVKSFEDVFKALNRNEISYGVLPIENSSTGGILEVYDLIKKYGFYINGEKIIKVDHNLLAIDGTTIEDIEEVYSHPQGFSQSCKFFENHPKWKLIPYFNTAVSAKYVKEANSKNKAAVASKKAAEIYGLNILKENINFNHNNYTRFIIIGKKLEVDEFCNKISIVLSISHTSGTLYNVLKYFAQNNLNLLKIESRPILNKPWEYFFYIDFEGNLEDKNTKNAISAVKENCSYFKVLGNYKSDK